MTGTSENPRDEGGWLLGPRTDSPGGPANRALAVPANPVDLTFDSLTYDVWILNYSGYNSRLATRSLLWRSGRGNDPM
jgi:hypothetical protein